MTKDVAINTAKGYMLGLKLEGYIIIKPIDDYSGQEYDYILFDSYLELRNMLCGLRAYDYLGFDAYLRENEVIIDVYSKSHLIIL